MSGVDDQVCADVADALGLTPNEISEHDDLFELGLDSLLLIRLASQWRRQGSAVTFEDLAADPTLAGWRAALGDSPAPAPVPTVASTVDEQAPFELATMQHAYWIGRQPGQPFSEVSAHFYVEFDGATVEPPRLQKALDALIARHDMLRVRFLDDGRQQITVSSALPTVRMHDLRHRPDHDAELARLREHYTHRRFDIDAGEAFEVALSLLPDGSTRMHVDLDMMVADALSMRILLNDLRALYEDPDAALPPIGYSFARYLADRHDGERIRARAWWRERLPDLPGGPALPLRHEPGGTPRTVRLHHWISSQDKAVLLAAAKRHGLTPAAALATAFAEVIGAWSADPRFLLNLPLFDRELLRDDVDLLVGDFSSSILLAVDLTEPMPFVERARQVQTDMRAAIAHGAYGGVEVLRDLARLGDGGPVLAPVVYTSALGLGEIYDADLQRCFGAPSWIISQGPQVWLDAQVTELDSGLLLNWDVRADVLAEGTAESAFEAYRELITGLLADDASWFSPVGSLVPPAHAAVRELLNNLEPVSPQQLLHEGFFRHAQSQPSTTALAGDGVSWTYAELAERALRVSALLASRGVRHGDSVAITLPKGPDQIVAALGVLATGAAYVPVSIDQPPERRARIHRLASAAVVLTDAEHSGAVRAACEPVLMTEAAQHRPASACTSVDPGALAYVLFTSGSTGDPKGVEVSHGAAMNSINAINARFEVGPQDRTLAVSALEFDLSVYDLFAPLSAGGAVVVVDEAARRDAENWWRLVVEHRVTVWNTAPALLDMLLAAADPGEPALRLVLLGGDWVGLDLPGRLRARVPDCRFVALGGMTEAAIHSTAIEVGQVPAHWRSMPWGAPLPGVACRVVDTQGRDRPDWVTGELWVGGASVARGYRGDPHRTADRFVEHAGLRWYRSGDLARYWSDGTLEFLGRSDHQVQVHGHRIELGEIEAALAAHPSVGQAVATVLDGPVPRLAAAVSTVDEVAADELLAWLGDRLPPYMVCDHVDVQPRLPLTRNGKLDRSAIAALLSRAVSPVAAEFQAPEGELEELVASVWAELLQVGAVGRDDGFFALGGDSLLATRLVGRLREAGVTGARLATLFARPALADFAASLALGGTDDKVRLHADLDHRHEPFPPTDVQRAYWIGRDERLPLGGVGTYQYAEFDGTDIDLDRLERAWQRLIDRHEMLRAVFDDDGEQRILADPPPFRIEVRNATGGDPQPALDRLRAEKSHRYFDLSRWPLFEVTALHYDADGGRRTRLAVGLDYILFDALSIMTLFSELDTLYRDPDARLPAIGMSFRDYVLQVNPVPEALERDQRYWLGRLDELPPGPTLPMTRDPSQVSRPVFGRSQTWLDQRRWQAIKDRARAAGLTPSTVLLTAYAEVLGTWSRQRQLTVTLTLFNRREVHPDIYRVLGDFTSLSLADYRPEAGEPWLETARRLQRQLGADLDHRDIAPSWLLRELARRTGNIDAMPVVFTSAIGVGDGVSMDMSPSFPERVWGISQSPQVCLDNQVLESQGGLLVTWDAVQDLFCNGVLDGMFAAYRRLLEWLADNEWTADLPDPLPHEQKQVRDRVNATDTPIPASLLHTPLFTTPADSDALIWQRGTLSHGELRDRALRLAAALVQRGVRPGDAVAITLPKGPDQIVAAVGVLCAGGVYVPVGVEQPRLRRERIYTDAGVSVVIDETGAGLDLPTALRADPLDEPVAVEPGALAYVIFTSGSTGTPKGVEITHEAAANTIADINMRYSVGPRDRVLAVSALDFDLSVYDVFGVLGAGGALVLPDEDERRDADRWLELATRHGVTLWNTVPMLLDMLLTAAELGGRRLPATLRLALVSGDWVPLDLGERVSAATDRHCRLVALGGATEASIWSNAFDVDDIGPDWRSVPYGLPLANQRYRVVDELGRDRPDWVAGELWIGGRGVAAGYRGDPARTTEKFTVHRGRRWYRTGDLGRYWPDGTLEFLGRADHQVKIGGHRLELAEIESALESCPGVRNAVVVAPGEQQRRTLHAFVERSAGLEVTSVRAELAERLPGYAIPARFTLVDTLPLTANGKLDRAAVLDLAGDDATGEPPSGDVETGLATLWAELLGHLVDDRDANFFGLGGNSLLALRVIGSVRQRFGVEIGVRDFLAAPTVAQLAAEVARIQMSTMDDYESGVL
ncbi:non-ribosomal peptide synthetase [Saccharopolyspora sp. ASAGF58]|uniref:non-ribosomal peptide synthetase n=1 Tax=Saccharopolyspora sp. ASAGF58 TaxID=2719023 RepID=UPI00143FFB86|nr:non-ribosomal peptide synthetase [Saccharopolyspora sp. ASAGF58]QIZ37201.1 amino acid adenylation domain-containing protein [Saccharopolyspora sp. ASAGF58]